MWITPKERFLREPVKQTSNWFKLHKMKSYAWRFYLRFLNSCEIWNIFSRAPIRNCLWCYYRWLITSIALEKCKKECDIAENILIVKVFFHWTVKITQFPDGFHLKLCNRVPLQLQILILKVKKRTNILKLTTSHAMKLITVSSLIL